MWHVVCTENASRDSSPETLGRETFRESPTDVSLQTPTLLTYAPNSYAKKLGVDKDFLN